MTRDETDPMPRFLLALCLYAVAAAALAGPPAGSDDTAGKPAKPAASTTATADQDGAAASAPAPTPSRTGTTTRASAKRWHSLLPGMIR